MEYTIKIINAFGKYSVCKWEAESKEKAIEEFVELNPAYIRKGNIVAE